jgi:phytoene/squalene synthetase
MKTPDATKRPTGLTLYTQAAERSSSVIIRSYSTSFGLAARLLAPEIRQHVENIYALVRVADEIVDGSAAEARAAGGKVDPVHALDDLEKEVYRALKDRFSANLVVHAFAHTANTVGFDRKLIAPFFESMRMDLWKTAHTKASFEKYVYGSAEVVGLMCLQAFILGESFSIAEQEKLIAGGRALGAAFQKVNFLRDLAADSDALGRSYFPGLKVAELTDAKRDELVADINADLAKSAISLRMLPKTSRRAVAAAHLLFEELNDAIAVTPASALITTRISVPNIKKLFIIIKVLLGGLPK